MKREREREREREYEFELGGGGGGGGEEKRIVVLVPSDLSHNWTSLVAARLLMRKKLQGLICVGIWNMNECLEHLRK